MLTIPNNCSGCGACQQKCPKDAIVMIENHEGFLYPKIDVAKCINCGICDKTCPIVNTNKEEKKIIKCYAAKNDDEIRKKSSSGGLFYALAENIISKGGVVFGVRFNDKFEAKFGYFEKMEDITPYMKSKYIQAVVGNAYKEVKDFLEKGRKVLFLGTPCQINGLHFFLGKGYDNLYTVEIVCHGVPATNAWRKYLNEKQKDGKIIGISHRSKQRGWRRWGLEIQYENRTVYSPMATDSFVKQFLGDNILRDSCYNCIAKKYNTKSDLAIGDFWAIQYFKKDLDDDKGISNVLSYTDKGEELLKELKSVFFLETPFNDTIKKCNGGLRAEVGKKKPAAPVIKPIVNEVITKNEPESSDVKKVGIMTLKFNTNYGGVMQSYALCKALTKMGYKPYEIEQRTLPAPFNSKEVGMLNTGNTNSANLHAVITGSDQIWRMKYACGNTINSFLGFCTNPNTRKLSYAASFGADSWEFTKAQEDSAKALIKDFKGISVREDSAVNFCKTKFGVEAEHVLDPTMLLSSEEYRNMIKGNVKKDFKGKIFSYILDWSNNKGNIISKLKQETGKENILLDNAKNHPSIYEWINGFANADFIITDSFHGCVFSIIFNKPFICINNITRGGARMKSLTKMFHIEDRMVPDSCTDGKLLKELSEKPLNTKDILKEWQDKSFNFLKRCLE